MVGFIHKSTIEEEEEEETNRTPNNTKPTNNSPSPFDNSAQDSFADSFLDFKAIEDWFQDISIDINMDEQVSCEKSKLDRVLSDGCEPIIDGHDCLVKVEKQKLLGFGDSAGSIEEVLGKVSLLSDVNVKSEVMSGDGEAERSAVLGDGSGRLNSVNSAVMRFNGELETTEVLGNISGRVNAVKSEVMRGDSMSEVDVCDGVYAVKSKGLSYDGEKERNTVVGNIEEINSHTKVGDQGYEEKEKSESSSEFEGSSNESPSSLSSSSSNSDDDDDNTEEESDDEGMENRKEGRRRIKLEVEQVGEMEEGEIRDVVGDGKDEEEEEDGNNGDENYVDNENADDMVGWSDAENDDDLVSGSGAALGPIRSKNELTVLPPVPPVNVTFQPNHQMIPVGVILSVISSQVIVEGMERHAPLSEGSVLWITESRVPLGLVDEIFGPVKNPYYVVRYNSESEVPIGIHQGTPIAFVPEFVSHVLSNRNLYKKGYDASGENDEEVSDEAEFSDDEKEAEHRRMQRMAKRGTGVNDQKPVNRKKNRKKFRHKGIDQEKVDSIVQVNQPQFNQSQHLMNLPSSLNQASPASCIRPGFNFGSGVMPPFPASVATAAASVPSLPWINGVPSQGSISAAFASGFSNGMPWSGNVNQTPQMMPLPNQMPFQPHFVPSQGLFPNAMLPLGQSNILGGPSYSTWPGLIGQNRNNQMTMGFGAGGQNLIPSFNGVQPGLHSHEEQAKQTCNENSAASIPNIAGAPNQFNMGTSSFRGKRPHHRGGRRFSRGRGRHQSN